MKTNLVSMPHMVEKAGDLSIGQSIIDAHPGSYWLYYRLPHTQKLEAVRISVHQIPPSRIGPRVLQWNGSIVLPSVKEPLTDDAGNSWVLTNGELTELPGAQKTLSL